VNLKSSGKESEEEGSYRQEDPGLMVARELAETFPWLQISVTFI